MDMSLRRSKQPHIHVCICMNIYIYICIYELVNACQTLACSLVTYSQVYVYILCLHNVILDSAQLPQSVIKTTTPACLYVCTYINTYTYICVCKHFQRGDTDISCITCARCAGIPGCIFVPAGGFIGGTRTYEVRTYIPIWMNT